MHSPLLRGPLVAFAACACVLGSIGAYPTNGQDALDAIDEEIARQRQIVERFVTVLERNPRRGTALDRIYGFHIENGTIEQFVGELRDRIGKDASDGTAWTVLGLIEAQRGHDADAVQAFTKAKELRPTDPMAAYYLGQSLVLVGQPENAAAAFEEAIDRNPPQADLLEIFQALGRVHQRAQRTEEALAVWSRLEKLFPNDPRVQEHIAVTLVEEGQSAAALPRYEALAKTTTDDYRKTVYRIEAAELKVRLNRASDGIADLEGLLTKLNPESWLFREVRRKIEEVFLRTDDQDGLAKYYAGWLAKNKEDVDAMARLARVLARQGRVPEAKEWLDRALKLAPSRKELRLAFIAQLVEDQRFGEAIEQYAALDKADPNNPDYLREWGKLILRDTARPKDERQSEAERVWRRLTSARPNDPLIATQVADLFRHAEMQEQALALYQQAVELAPASPQYREYLGEYFHLLKRPEEAQATWRQIAEGKLRTAENLQRLAEVFAQFGYLKEALPEIAAACELAPKDFSLQLKAADLQIRGEQHRVALESLARAESLAQNDEEREAVLAQQIKAYQLQNRLTQLAADLDRETAGGNATPKQWFLLARYREALREWPEATRAINETLKLQPNSIPSLASAGRIAEQAGDLKTAADLNRKLAVVDRRGRSEYLEHVAQLETQLGRIDEALAAGRDLIAAAPGNVETYQFFADLCFRLGKPDDGLAALRRATRVNPNDANILLALAAALAGQFRTDEAIELYWQAFEKGGELDDKLNVIGKLGELYLQTNHFDQLLERLERGRREADQRREMTICLAQAYHSAGDYGMARQELERLLSENTRDTQLLQQLSKLAESEADMVSAVKYQEQLVRLAPGPESEYRLATLLARAGDAQEAGAILVRLALKEDDQEKLLRNIDGLLGNGQHETALAVTEPKLRENASDWELLFREGVALAQGGQTEEARRRFQAILALTIDDDELGIAAKNRLKSQKQSSLATAASAADARLNRLNDSYSVRRGLGIDRNYYSSSPTASRVYVWTPSSFAAARMGAMGWLYKLALETKESDAFMVEQRQRAEAPDASVRELWDWVYLQSVVQQQQDLLPIAKRMAEQGELPEQFLYLQQLASRRSAPSPSRSGAAPKDTTPPLPPDEMALALKCFEAVRRLPATPNSSTYSYVHTATSAILTELRRAGRKEQEQQLYQDMTAKAESVDELYYAMQLALGRGDAAAFLALFDRLAAKDLQNGDQKSPTAARGQSLAAQQLGQFLGNAKTTPDQALATLDKYLSYHAAKNNQRLANPTYRPPTRTASQRSNYIYYWVGRSQRSVSLTFPTVGEYYDQMSLSLLRTVFEVFRQKDLVSDLVKHLEANVASATAVQKLYAALALGYVQAWSDDRESAAITLAQASDLMPQDMELRLDVARLRLEMQEMDEALAIVESIAPLDQRVLQQRETMALDLAVRLGDHERARQAAQRLFGLRLDAETQVALAGQMRRLGMNEEAEAVMARAQRQAGSRLSALAALMTQYQSEGRMDVAAQVAFQILRRSRTASSAQAAQGYRTADSQYRDSALACLAQAGKIKELIAGLEEQIERSPKATQLYETLAEYYQAAGETQKSLDLKAKLVELSPDDGDLRFAYAQELYRRGKYDDACEHYIVVVKKQPQLLSNRYYEVIRAFQQAKKETELAQAMGEIDLKAIRQPYYVSQLIGNLIRTPEGREAGLALFKKAWEDFPAQRPELMSSFHDDEVWKLPEVIEYGKQALLPTAEAVKNDPWYGIYSGSMSFSSEGRVTTNLNRVLDGAAQSNQLAELRKEIVAAADEHPAWQAGPLLLTMIDLRLKKPIDAREAIQPLLDAEGDDYRLMYARWIVGQELESTPAHRELAIAVYDKAMISPRSGQQFEYSPGARLFRLYNELGQRDDARNVLLRAASDESWRSEGDLYYVSQRVQTMLAIGKFFQELDDPAAALRMYREVLTNPTFNDPQVAMSYTSRPEYFTQQAEQGLQAIIKQYSDKPSGEFAQALVAPAENPAPEAPVIDLMVAAAPAGANQLATLDSPLVKLIRPAGLPQAAIDAIESQLAALAEDHPGDVSVAVARCLFALQGQDAAKQQAALDRLGKLVDETPLEDIPARQRPNARQRADAARQLGLWLVARECLKQPDRASIGEKLTERALVAAQRQLDATQLTAILYERGKIALDGGDRSAAERIWNELVDLAIVQPRVPRGRSSAANSAENAAALQTPPRTTAIPATLSQFNLAAAIAQAAAERDLKELSLRAVREALSGGLPVPDPPKASTDPFGAPVQRIVRSTAALSGRGDVDQQVFTQLATRMWQLSQAWKDHDFPPADVCQLLEGLVFPANRPSDVLLYEQPLTTDLSSPRSVGRLLVEWAIRADRIEELNRQIAARQATPSDVVSGYVLLAQLHVARGETADAQANLQAIGQQLEASKLASLVNVAAHAAASALDDERLAQDAAPLLDKLITSTTGRNYSSGVPSASSPVTILTRMHLKRGDRAAAEAQVERYLQARQAFYARYSGDSGTYYQRLDLAWGANELARAGDLETTMGALARFADVPAVRNRDVPVSVAVWHLARQAGKLPPQERYERLREWTLPTKDRRSVRHVADFDSGQPIPDVFLPPESYRYDPQTRPELLSNLTLLAMAADEAGQLAELRRLIEPLANEKVAAADSLNTLLMIRQEDAAAIPRLAALAGAIRERLTPPPAAPAAPTVPAGLPAPRQSIPAIEFDEYLVVRAALAVPEFAEEAAKAAEQLLDQARRTQNTELIAHLTHDLAQHQLRAVAAEERRLALSPSLAHWQASPGSAWTAHDRHLMHVTGDGGSDELVFRYPLAGDFEFSFDVRAGGFAHFQTGFAGLNWSITGNQFGISSGSESLARLRLPMNDGGWNRFAVRVAGNRLRFYCNGHLIFEDDDYSRTSPWLRLGTAPHEQPVLKTLRITGDPVIPREVNLLEGDRLEGWQAWQANLPKRLTAKEASSERAAHDPFGEPIAAAGPQEFDWSVKDGVLQGRLDSSAGRKEQTRLYYHRPLLSGDIVRYQFRYQAGKVDVHPALGQIAFLLEPDGVRLHWIDAPLAAGPLEVKSDNVLLDPASRRGPARLPLKENDWNDVELATNGETLTIRLNGELVCERAIESTNSRQFSLFRYKGQTAEVRGITLTGDWPAEFSATDQADLLVLADQTASPAIRTARHSLIGEQVLSSGAYEVWQQSRDLAGVEKFKSLKQWVLPNESHPTLRLQVDWTPTDPPVPATTDGAAPTRRLAHSGGELVSPALELVAVAKELGKLGELKTAAAIAEKELPDQARNVAAFECLLALAAGDDKAATAGLKQSLEFVKQQPAETPLHERHAELLVAHASLGRPALRAPLKALAQQLVNDQKRPRYLDAHWERRVRHLLDLANRQTMPPPLLGENWKLTQWQPANSPTAELRGLGFAPPTWWLAPGEAAYRTGNARDALYLAMPLTGNFEVRLERGTNGWREMRPLYGGVAIDVNYDGLSVVRQEVGRGAITRKTLAAKPKDWGPTVEQRLAVKDGTLTVYINGEQVHSEPLPPNADPWLAIETKQPHNSGSVKNVQITGNPQIPKDVTLSSSPSLAGWAADYYGETAGTEGSIWSKKVNEIVAARLENSPGSFRESVLQYHRPLLEDGEVEYEFYYEPGKTEVHPALDRLVFLLRPEGARLHWMTDAQYDRTGLSPDNATPIAGSTPVPLKAGAWNELKLALAQDEATVFVNGEEVARQTLAATNQRTLGLFRYSDASGVRVRNVVLRGQWPKELPPVDKQELAILGQ